MGNNNSSWSTVMGSHFPKSKLTANFASMTMAEDISDKITEMMREAGQIRSAMRLNLPEAEVQALQRRAQLIPSTLTAELEELYPSRTTDRMQRMRYEYDLDRVNRFLDEQVLPVRTELAQMRRVVPVSAKSGEAQDR